MGDLSKHFNRAEFACSCGCGFDTVDYSLVLILEELREFFNAPITIKSGCRCAEYNKSIGGAKNSQHLYGRAADIVVKGVTPSSVYHKAKELLNETGGLGSYTTFTHIDTRTNGPARWVI